MSERAVAYAWRLVHLNADGASAVTASSTAKNPRYFKLGAHSLEASSSYALVVTVTDWVLGTNNSASMFITVESGSVVAVLDGGNRVVSTSEEIVVDASRSFDEDVDPSGDEDEDENALFFQWNCSATRDAANKSLASGCAALVVAEVGAVLRVAGASLGAGAFAFDVVVSAADGRSDAARVVLTLVVSEPPAVAVLTASSLANRAEKLVLSGTVFAVSDGTAGRVLLNTTWSMSGELAGGVSLADAARSALTVSALSPLSSEAARIHNLVVRPGALVAGATYVFTLVAEAGAASISVTVRQPPSSGSLEVIPSSGFALATRFALGASQWVSDELPLKYKFSAGAEVLRTAALEPRLKDVVLATGAPNVSVVVTVLDAVDSEASRATSVRVVELSLTREQLSNATDVLLANAFAMNSLDGVCQTVSASANTAMRNDSALLAALVAALAEATAAYVDDDRPLVEQTIAALVPVVATPDALLFDSALDALELANSLTAALARVGVGGADSSAPDSTATVISSLLDSTLFKFETNASSTAASRRRRLSDDDENNATTVLLDTVDALSRALLDGLVMNEDAAGARSQNFNTASQRVAQAAEQEVILTLEGMESSAKLEADGGDSDYETTISEFSVDPYVADAPRVRTTALVYPSPFLTSARRDKRPFSLG